MAAAVRLAAGGVEREDLMTKQEQAELGQRALQAFERELPQLWEERPGQWVAYQGERRLGFAEQKHELYQRCFEQGLSRDEFVVFCIEPLMTEVIFGVDAGG
jgi:hypothetical protein